MPKLSAGRLERDQRKAENKYYGGMAQRLERGQRAAEKKYYGGMAERLDKEHAAAAKNVGGKRLVCFTTKSGKKVSFTASKSSSFCK